MRKGEIVCNKQFLLISQFFLPYMTLIFHFKCTVKCRLQFISILTSLKFCHLVMDLAQRNIKLDRLFALQIGYNYRLPTYVLRNFSSAYFGVIQYACFVKWAKVQPTWTVQADMVISVSQRHQDPFLWSKAHIDYAFHWVVNINTRQPEYLSKYERICHHHSRTDVFQGSQELFSQWGCITYKVSCTM